MSAIRKNVAGQGFGFCLVDSSTGGPKAGATVTVYRVIDGGAQAAATGTVTGSGNGQYWFAASQADVNGNEISFLFIATGAVPVEKTIITTAGDPTDAASGGLTNLDAAISTRMATFSLPTNFAALGIGVTGHITTVDTCATNSDMRGTDNALLAANYTSPLSAAATANAVWDELTAGHVTAGSFGVLLTGTLDAAVSTRLATAGYSAPDNADIAAIKAKTDNLPAAPAAVGSAMTLEAGAITTAAIADGAITDAKFTVPTEPSAPATGILSMIFQIWAWFVGRKTTLNTVTGDQKLYKADGTTVAVTQVTSDDGTTQTKGAGA